MWMVLMPRELEVIKRPIPGTDGACDLLRVVQSRLKGDEIDLPSGLLVACAANAANYRHPTAPAFAMLLKASERHS